MPTAQEIQTLLTKARDKRSRIQGAREKLIADLKSMGHENLSSVQAEIDELDEFIKKTEPAITEQYDAFIAEYGTLIETL